MKNYEKYLQLKLAFNFYELGCIEYIRTLQGLVEKRDRMIGVIDIININEEYEKIDAEIEKLAGVLIDKASSLFIKEK